MSFREEALSLTPAFYFPLEYGFNNLGTASATTASGTNLFSIGTPTFQSPTASSGMHGPDVDGFMRITSGSSGFYNTEDVSLLNDLTFTISGWFRAEAEEDRQRYIFDNRHGHDRVSAILTASGGFRLVIEQSNTIYNANGYEQTRLDDQMWHHFVATSNSGAVSVFIDGKSPVSSTSTISGSVTLDDRNKYFGIDYTQNDDLSFKGDLSHISLYTNSISASAARELYATGGETYPYWYIGKAVWQSPIIWTGMSASSTHPITNYGTAGDGTTTGTYLSTNTASDTFILPNGFEFDRGNGNGVEKTPQDVVLFNGRSYENYWFAHFWAKHSTSFTDYSTIFRNSASGGNGQVVLLVNGENVANANKAEAFIGGKSLYSTTLLNDDDWHHIMISYAGSRVGMWIDGNLEDFEADTGMAHTWGESAAPLRFGRNVDDPAELRFIGQLDEAQWARPGANSGAAQTIVEEWLPLFYRFGEYQRTVSLIEPASASYAASVGTASAFFPSASWQTTSVTASVLFDSEIFSASALMVDPSVELPKLFTASAFSASALMLDSIVSASANINFSASAMNITNSLFVDPNVSVEYNIVLDNIDAMTASALMLNAIAGLSKNVDGELLTASALMTSASIGLGLGVGVEPFTASSLFVDPTTFVVANVLFKTYNQVVLEKTPFTYLTFEDVLPAEIDTPLTTIRYFRNTSGSLSYGIIDSSNISVNNTFPEVQLYTEFSPIGTVNGDYALANDGLSYVNIPESSGTTNFTISVFVNGTNTIQEWKFLEAAGFSFHTKQNTFNAERLIYVTWSGGSFVTPGGADWDGSQKYKHIGITKSGTSMSVYIDGTLNFTATVPNNSLSGQTIYGPSQIDEFATFEKVLTADEINDLANTNYRRKSFNFTRTVEMIDPHVGTFISVLADTFSASANFVQPASVTISTQADATPMAASAIFPEPVVTAQIVYIQENNYIIKLKEIGAEIGVAKTIEVDNEWIDYNSEASSSANFVFGINNINSGLGDGSAFPSAPATSASLTCDNTKWGGVFTGTQFMNFYPTYDRYAQTQVDPTQGQITGNEDWRYNEFTGPWYYTTTEDSYELVFRTDVENQILLSGQSTYTLEDENTTNTLEDDTRVNTYIEYGLTDGKLYVTYYRDLDENPITIIGNTNIADGQDHHIVMQRTSSAGMYRSSYLLNMNIGNANQWSLESNVDRHAVVGPQNVDDVFYSDPFTGEIFHGFEIWIDGVLDTRSASFNSTHIAPIVKSLGGRTYIYQTQNQVGQTINNRATTSGIVGILTTFFARFNTERINALSSYYDDVVDMPRFPQEAKILRHAALEPDTIKVLSGLALAEGKEASATLLTASGLMVDPIISTNVSKILRLYWNVPNTVGTNFGTTSDGKQYAIDTYSVTHQLANNPSHVYNVDAAERNGLLDPVGSAEPVIIDRWKDSNGNDRLINIETDIDMDEYETIVFMDYVNSSDEITSILPNNNYVYVENELNQFINRLKNAVINGKSLYVSDPALAIDLGIINGITVIEQSYESNDLTSASINPFITNNTVYFDTHRNNMYEIVNEWPGITNINGYVLTDAISYSRSLNDEYHLKFENKEFISSGDTFIIPSLPLLPSQLNRDYAGYTNNRITDLNVMTSDQVLTGSAIAKLSGTDYITTLVIPPTSLLGSASISGRIFVNFVEDALTMGLSDYNYGIIQTGLTEKLLDETSETIEWNYSTSRTTRKLSPTSNIIYNTGINGQTYPTDGGGGPIVQAPTSSNFGNIRIDYDSASTTFTSSIYFDESSEIYSTQKIFVPSMTLRGLNWLTDYSSTGEITKIVNAMSASASMPYEINSLWANKNIINLIVQKRDTIILKLQEDTN